MPRLAPLSTRICGFAPVRARCFMGCPVIATVVLAAGMMFLAACGQDGEPPGNGRVVAQFVGERLIVAGQPRAGVLANPHLSPGKQFTALAYEVPAFPCVRTDTDDYFHIPEATESPGKPGVFAVVPPARPDAPILMLFHGNGLDFIEALASLFVHAAPRAAEQILREQPGFVGFIEILNQNGAWRGIEGELRGPVAAEALERGWGLVVPGNCWGDGGHHRGEVIDYYIRAPRYGRAMDDFVWDFYRAHFPHDHTREYSFGCSGGGQRTAQLLLQRPGAVVAAGIDSPADFLLGFREDPPSLFALLQGIPEFRTVLDDFYLRHYGSFGRASEQSLGTQLLPRGIDTPIFFTYSSRDPLVTPAVTRPLAEALLARQPSDLQFVHDTGETVHCQIQDRAGAGQVLDWLSRWRRQTRRVSGMGRGASVEDGERVRLTVEFFPQAFG